MNPLKLNESIQKGIGFQRPWGHIIVSACSRKGKSISTHVRWPPSVESSKVSSSFASSVKGCPLVATANRSRPSLLRADPSDGLRSSSLASFGRDPTVADDEDSGGAVNFAKI